MASASSYPEQRAHAAGRPALPYPRARQVWMLLATAALLGAIAATAALAFSQARVLGLEDSRRVWIVLAAFVPSALNSTSVHNDIRAGSVGCLLLLLLALAAWMVLPDAPAVERRDARPPGRPSGPKAAGLGFLLAVATVAKLTPFVLVPWAARRGFRPAAAVALGLLVLSMVPAFAPLGRRHLRGLLALGDRAGSPRRAPPMNQSLDAFLSRLLVPSDVVDSPFDAPVLKWVLSLGFGTTLAAATVWMVSRRRVPAGLVPVEMGLVLLATLALMKLTWVQTLAAMLWVWPAVR